MARKNRKPQIAIRRVGIDTGGTFTDFVYEAAGKIKVFKVASTPDDPSRAIVEGLQRIATASSRGLSEIEVVHGTTVGTNALLQRRGARVALITTAGFEDVIEIGRQARPELYNLNAVKPPPLVSTELRFGVAERIACDGEVLESLATDELNRLIGEVQRAHPEAIAVCLLFRLCDPSTRSESPRRWQGCKFHSQFRIKFCPNIVSTNAPPLFV